VIAIVKETEGETNVGETNVADGEKRSCCTGKALWSWGAGSWPRKGQGFGRLCFGPLREPPADLKEMVLGLGFFFFFCGHLFSTPKFPPLFVNFSLPVSVIFFSIYRKKNLFFKCLVKHLYLIFFQKRAIFTSPR
jgi:hypothetical protein